MKIAIGSDHAGFGYKEKLIDYLSGDEYEFEDFGTHSEDSVDYPEFAHPVSNAVAGGSCEIGILICGTGNGVCMTANKHDSIRAGLCWNPEIAQLIRRHNNANICCIPARFVSDQEAIEIITAFLNTEFEGGRHKRRIDKISIC